MYKIDKNIEQPESTLKRYPFEEMEVGDSFFAPLDKGKAAKLQNSILGAGRKCRHKNRKFSTRVIKSEEDKRIGVRCWRIE